MFADVSCFSVRVIRIVDLLRWSLNRILVEATDTMPVALARRKRAKRSSAAGHSGKMRLRTRRYLLT